MILLDSMITTTNDSGESSQVKMFLALYDNLSLIHISEPTRH